MADSSPCNRKSFEKTLFFFVLLSRLAPVLFVQPHRDLYACPIHDLGVALSVGAKLREETPFFDDVAMPTSFRFFPDFFTLLSCRETTLLIPGPWNGPICRGRWPFQSKRPKVLLTVFPPSRSAMGSPLTSGGKISMT